MRYLLIGTCGTLVRLFASTPELSVALHSSCGQHIVGHSV